MTTLSPTLPRWYRPVAIAALLWNLAGCAAYLSDVTLTADDVAQMTPAQQTLYQTRPTWAVTATAVAVWGGAAGCLGLILRRRSAMAFLLASLAGVIVQDIGLFLVADAASLAGPTAVILQGLVLAIAVALVVLARTAMTRGWIR